MRRVIAFTVILIISGLSQLLVTSCVEEPVYYPVLATIPVQDSDVTSVTAKLKAEITDLGNQKISEYGIEVYKKSIASPAGKQGYLGTPVPGVYEVNFTGLEPNTLYYYRAYVLINTAEFYSQNTLHQFTTKPAGR